MAASGSETHLGPVGHLDVVAEADRASQQTAEALTEREGAIPTGQVPGLGDGPGTGVDAAR